MFTRSGEGDLWRQGPRERGAEAQGVEWRVLRKATRKRKLNCADQSFNMKSNRTRARVEHIFGAIAKHATAA